jgi:hypothetical protein
MVRGPNRVLTPLKSDSKSRIHFLFLLPKSSFGMGRELDNAVDNAVDNAFDNAFDNAVDRHDITIL